MAKRKGSAYALVPKTAVVTSPEPSSPSNNVSLGSNCPMWAKSLQIMSNLLNCYDDASTNEDIERGRQCSTAILQLEEKQKEITEKSNIIKEELNRRIQQSSECYRNEMDELSEHQQYVHTLQKECTDMKEKISNLDQDKEKSIELTEQFRKEASEEIEKIDSIEAQRMMEVPKLKHQISLYASTTAIKWDFTRVHLHAGHISIPSLGVHRRFEIDPEDYSQFEIANMLWSYMDNNSSLFK